MMQWTGVCRQAVSVRSSRSLVAHKTGVKLVQSQGQVPGGDQSKHSQVDSWDHTQESGEIRFVKQAKVRSRGRQKTGPGQAEVAKGIHRRKGIKGRNALEKLKINQQLQRVTGFLIKAVWF